MLQFDSLHKEEPSSTWIQCTFAHSSFSSLNLFYGFLLLRVIYLTSLGFIFFPILL
jgi:hypothetical protein